MNDNKKIARKYVTTESASAFCDNYLYFAKGKVVSVDKAFAFYTSFYEKEKTEENLNAFIVGFLRSGQEIANLDDVLFFYNLSWKQGVE